MNLENNEVKFNHGVTPVASDRGDKLHRTLSQFVLRLEKDNRSSISSADRMSWTWTCNVRAAYKFYRRVERAVSADAFTVWNLDSASLSRVCV